MPAGGRGVGELRRESNHECSSCSILGVAMRRVELGANEVMLDSVERGSAGEVVSLLSRKRSTPERLGRPKIQRRVCDKSPPFDPPA